MLMATSLEDLFMNVTEKFPSSPSGQYYSSVNLNLYDSPQCNSLASQIAAGRHIKVLSSVLGEAVEVSSCEDNYAGWLTLQDIKQLQSTSKPYQSVAISREEIEQRIPEIIAFTKAAMAEPNYYLWGGTVAPNYDCSGLMQAAFSSQGVWLPRDSYQQAAFTTTITLDDLLPGDLIFFSKGRRVDHVALYLGEDSYIHSSGAKDGRNGIGIDSLIHQKDEIGTTYRQRITGAGRVVCSYRD